MRQRQLFRVQRDAGNQRPFFASAFEPVIRFQARKPERFAAVKFIADDGQSGVAQVDANLVGAAGERLAAEQRPAGEFFQHFKNRSCAFAVFRVNPHQAGFHRMRREPGVHLEFVLRRRSLHEGGVLLERFFGTEQIGQRDERRLGFGEQDDAAGFEIKPVRIHQIIQPAFARPRFAAGDGGVEQLHQIWPLRVVTVGRGQKSGGFVEREQVFVFKQDGNFPKLARGG